MRQLPEPSMPPQATASSLKRLAILAGIITLYLFSATLGGFLGSAALFLLAWLTCRGIAWITAISPVTWYAGRVPSDAGARL
jgi:hypothetical protein